MQSINSDNSPVEPRLLMCLYYTETRSSNPSASFTYSDRASLRLILNYERYRNVNEIRSPTSPSHRRRLPLRHYHRASCSFPVKQQLTLRSDPPLPHLHQTLQQQVRGEVWVLIVDHPSSVNLQHSDHEWMQEGHYDQAEGRVVLIMYLLPRPEGVVVVVGMIVMVPPQEVEVEVGEEEELQM